MHKPIHVIGLLSALCLALLAAATWAADLQLEVVDLKHRPAEQLVGVVQTLLGQDEVVQAHGFQLILRARPATLEQVKTLVGRLDRAPRRLRVSLRHSAAEAVSRSGTGAGVSASPGESRVRVETYGTRDRDYSGAEQQIQVLEGNSAWIEFGQSIPLDERSVVIGPYGASAQESVRFRDVTSGFYVLPQVTGDRVRLRISPHRETLAGSGSGAINVQRAETVVEGPIGEWFEIGGTISESGHDGAGIVYRTQGRAERQGRILVKVDVLP